MLLSFDYEPYIAIIGDIRNSRLLADRKEIQIKLGNVLDHINREYAPSISAKFMITLGDEFQGLLCMGKDIIGIIEKIQGEMYPVQIRFGIGVGEITTDINEAMAIGADGPGYYKARESIEILKSSEQKNKTQTSDIRIGIDQDENSVSMLLNTIFSLMEVIRRSWTDRQREIIYEFEKHEMSQIGCAKRLNITQSSVHRSLLNGNFYAYKSAKETVNNVLGEIGKVHV